MEVVIKSPCGHPKGHHISVLHTYAYTAVYIGEILITVGEDNDIDSRSVLCRC